MKTTKMICAGIAAMAMASSSAFALDIYEHAVTLTLRGSIEGPEVYKESGNSNKYTYSYVSKFIVGKYSNKEFLLALVEDGLITDIKGWAIKYLVDSDGNPLGLFIVKKGVPPILINSYAGFESEEVVEEYSDKYTEFANGDDESSGTWTERGLGAVWIEVPGLDVYLDGSYVISGDWKYSYDWESDEETYLEKIKSGSFDDLIGTIGGFDSASRDVVLGDDTAIVGGYVTIGSGKLADLSPE